MFPPRSWPTGSAECRRTRGCRSGSTKASSISPPTTFFVRMGKVVVTPRKFALQINGVYFLIFLVFHVFLLNYEHFSLKFEANEHFQNWGQNLKKRNRKVLTIWWWMVDRQMKGISKGCGAPMYSNIIDSDNNFMVKWVKIKV